MKGIQVRVRPTGLGSLRVEILQPDRPFLFRTFLEVVRSMGLAPHDAKHPILVASRRGVQRVLRPARPRDENRLSRIVAEVAPVAREGSSGALPAPETLRKRLLSAFGDVARAAVDYPREKRLLADAIRDLDRLSQEAPPRRAAEIREAVEFLSWLYDDNFVFLGTSEGRKKTGPVLAVEKSPQETFVYRAGHLDAIRVLRLDADGHPRGERIFRGLFSDAAERTRKAELPFLRGKYEKIRRILRLVPDSHDDHALARLFDGYPLDLLFASPPEALAPELALSLEGPGETGVRLAFRHDPVRQGLALTVLLEEEAFHQPLIGRIARRVARSYPSERPEIRVRLDAPSRSARIHYFFPGAARLSRAAESVLARAIGEIAQRWETRFEEALAASHGEEEGRRLALRYAGAFSAEYKVGIPPEFAVRDAADIEATLALGRLSISWGVNDPDASYLKVFLPGTRRALSDLAPILTNHGLVLLTEASYPIYVGGGNGIHLHILRVIRAEGGGAVRVGPGSEGERLLESMLPCFLGDGISDRLSGLILAAGLDAREVSLFQALHDYVRQIGTVHTRRSIHNTLLAHPAFLRDLLRLFRGRHDPRRRDGGLAATRAVSMTRARLRARLEDYLVRVASLDEDRILRAFREIVEGIVRTNFFLPGRATYAFKIDAAKLAGLPAPRPWREIFVWGPAVEGTHLRFGPISRGGIRASDRPDDYRTEVLGLAATQTVKNAQIVPTGAKGGFVLKKPGLSVRDGYEIFIRALLDLADNAADGSVDHPAGVVVHDGADPYFVVAADKGTATMSDLANSLAAENGFWLGDAFASGGSKGYDHKALGITARGAWEAVRRHIAGAGLEEKDLTVAGIGDMSGDVFGNGMLLSKKLRLVAAFDHRHIFLDPDPSPDAAFRERLRLFRLPKSSWADYDARRISAGGGVFPRAAKRIPLSRRMREVLGTASEALDGEGLVRAVLCAPIVLLYNGGIGTYVKSEDETHAEVGDPANDAVRVNAETLRAKIVAEGGNLGFTQRARVAFARRGGRIHTDAADNAAGVTLSDREVNLKILLGSAPGRDRLVRDATREVVESVLDDTRGQFLALSLDAARAATDLDPFLRLAADLEKRGIFDPRRHRFPDAEEIAERRARAASQGGAPVLVLPELALLLAHAKIDYTTRLLESLLLNHEGMDRELARYFPASVARRAGGGIARHPLRKQIIATTLVNRFVNRHGATLLHRLTTETGLAASRVTEGLLHAERILGLDGLEEAIEKYSPRIGEETTRAIRRALAETAEEIATWLIREIGGLRKNLLRLPLYDGALDRILTGWRRMLPPAEVANFLAELGRLQTRGVPPDLAERLVAASYLRSFLDAVRISQEKKTSLSRSARLLFDVGLSLSYPSLLGRLAGIPAPEGGVRAATRFVAFDLRRARRRIVERMLGEGIGIKSYLAERVRSFETIRSLVERIERGERSDLSAFVALAHQIENLAAI